MYFNFYYRNKYRDLFYGIMQEAERVDRHESGEEPGPSTAGQQGQGSQPQQVQGTFSCSIHPSSVASPGGGRCQWIQIPFYKIP